METMRFSYPVRNEYTYAANAEKKEVANFNITKINNTILRIKN